jgi:alkyl sulfatase BDS1-like metallo-beta-lactamase superfamily hydrolase
VPAETLAKPYLRPFYDEPEFVVHNVWRRYGGWWDLNPANLKPSPDAVLATEMATLAGGAMVLARRGVEVADAGDLRLACHLVEFAVLAEPRSTGVHEARAEIYAARSGEQVSSMARNILNHAALASRDGRRDLAGDDGLGPA